MKTRFLSTIKPFLLIFFLLLLFPFLLEHHAKPQVQAPINSPAIAEYQQTQAVRELLSPSVFTLEAKLFVSETDTKTQKENRFFCAEGYGTAFAVSEKGYFITNSHVIEPESKKTACLEGLSKTRKVPISALFGSRFEIKYFLTDFQKDTFPVVIFKAFPEKDIAILKYAGKNQAKRWKPGEFRFGSPSIRGGKVFSVEKSLTMPLIIPDEPVITMGTPLELPFTIIEGMLGNGVFQSPSGNVFIHFIAPNNSGNSGGPLVSLLDFKIIGMTTVTKSDNRSMSEQAGAIPFWEIIKALRTIDMK